MVGSNLIRQQNLEGLLQGANVPLDKIATALNEIGYFDEYYLTADGKLVKVFHQEFRKDPYMNLSFLPRARLISYPNDIDIEELDKETIKNFKKRLDEKRLRKYLETYQKRIKTKVLRILGR